MIFERNDNLDIETSDENITGSETSMGNVTSMESGMGTMGSSMKTETSMGSGIQNMRDECQNLMNYHASFMTKYGNRFDGIIESAGPDYVVILVAEDVVDQGDERSGQVNKKIRDSSYDRQRKYINPRRYRRFRRRPFPYNTLSGIAVLPYPYYAPPYPYYPF